MERPKRVVGDKGYTGRRIRSYLRRRGIGFTIPRLSNEPRIATRTNRLSLLTLAHQCPP